MAAKRKSATAKGEKAPRASLSKPRGKTACGRKTTSASKTASARWSARVMAHSDAMDLRSDVFKLKSAHAIARSLKRSSETSERRKATPFLSAMSMLNFERSIVPGRICRQSV